MLKYIVSVLILFFLCGCTVVGVGTASAVGGSYYLMGEIQKKYPVSIYHLYQVSLYTFQQEGIQRISVQNTKTDAHIVGKMPDGSEVKVHIFYDENDMAVLGIRIGTIGDEKRSRRLHEKMKEYI